MCRARYPADRARRAEEPRTAVYRVHLREHLGPGTRRGARGSDARPHTTLPRPGQRRTAHQDRTGAPNPSVLSRSRSRTATARSRGLTPARSKRGFSATLRVWTPVESRTDALPAVVMSVVAFLREMRASFLLGRASKLVRREQYREACDQLGEVLRLVPAASSVRTMSAPQFSTRLVALKRRSELAAKLNDVVLATSSIREALA